MGLFGGKINYSIKKKENLIVQRIKGEYTSRDLIVVNKKILSDKEYQETHNWLVDLRYSKALFNLDKIESINDFFEKNISRFKGSKMAFVVANSRQASIITHSGKFFKERNFNLRYKLFPSERSALEWIQASDK